MSNQAKIIYNNQTFEAPVIKGSEGELGLDISKLRGSTGLVTYDVAYKNTGATQSSITFIDGEKGILRHRGYSIEDLANNASFLEVAFLLLKGHLPNKKEYENYADLIRMHTLVNEDVKHVFQGFPNGSHPMGQLMTMMSMMSAFYPDSLNPHRSEEDFDMTITRLIAKTPTLVAMIQKKKMGHPLVYPKNNLEYVDNFLNMTFGQVTEEYAVDPVLSSAMNKLLILHADHEQNCSASTVRIVGSSQSNLYASISAGIAALWGPSHGGANQRVLEMLEEISKDGGNVQKFIDRAKDKNDPFRLMGFGHRVYKNFDPRARIIKKSADEVLGQLKVNDPILHLAKELEEKALADPYFAERKLFPNVDFYSGIIYRAMGFPVDMFTVLFALGRMPGWIAQWNEMRKAGQPIGRPRQIYTGEGHRPYPSWDERG